MAKITKLEFEVSPGSSIDTLLLVVKTTLRFTDFDRPTRLEYVLTHRLFGVSGGRLRHRPPEAAGTSPITPDGLDLDLDLEIEAATELQSFRRSGSEPPARPIHPMASVRSTCPTCSSSSWTTGLASTSSRSLARPRTRIPPSTTPTNCRSGPSSYRTCRRRPPSSATSSAQASDPEGVERGASSREDRRVDWAPNGPGSPCRRAHPLSWVATASRSMSDQTCPMRPARNR